MTKFQKYLIGFLSIVAIGFGIASFSMWTAVHRLETRVTMVNTEYESLQGSVDRIVAKYESEKRELQNGIGELAAEKTQLAGRLESLQSEFAGAVMKSEQQAAMEKDLREAIAKKDAALLKAADALRKLSKEERVAAAR